MAPQSKIISSMNSVLHPKGTTLPKKQPVLQRVEREMDGPFGEE